MSPRRIFQQQRKVNLHDRIMDLIPGYTEFYTHLPVTHPMLFGQFPYPAFNAGGVFAARVGFYATAITMSVAANNELDVLLGSKTLSMRNSV